MKLNKIILDCQKNPNNYIRCDLCGGKGTIHHANDTGGIICPKCEGATILNVMCKVCKGSGVAGKKMTSHGWAQIICNHCSGSGKYIRGS